MKKILGLLVAVLAIGIIAYVFINNTGGETEEDSNRDDNNSTEPSDEFDEGGKDDMELIFSLDESENGFVYTVHNEGEKVETVSFTTSQRFEYEISNADGVINKYSNDKAFMQVLEDVTIEPGDNLTFDIKLPDLEPGEYTIKIFLTAKDLAAASEVTETFEVE